MPIQDIIYFCVHENLSDLSDHCQISIRLNGLNFKIPEEDNRNFLDPPAGFKWDKITETTFIDEITAQKEVIKKLENEIMNHNVDIDGCVNELSNILIGAANKSLEKKVYRNRTKTNKIWFNNKNEIRIKEIREETSF